MFNIMKFSKRYDVERLVGDAEYFYGKYRNNQINLKKYRTVGDSNHNTRKPTKHL